MDDDVFDGLRMIFVEAIYTGELAESAESERDACAAVIRTIKKEDAMKILGEMTGARANKD